MFNAQITKAKAHYTHLPLHHQPPPASSRALHHHRTMRASLRRLALAFTSFRLKDPHLPAVLSSAQEIVGSSVHDESPDRKPATMTSDIHSKLGKFASKHGDALFGFIESAHIGSNSGDEGGAATVSALDYAWTLSCTLL